MPRQISRFRAVPRSIRIQFPTYARFAKIRNQLYLDAKKEGLYVFPGHGRFVRIRNHKYWDAKGTVLDNLSERGKWETAHPGQLYRFPVPGVNRALRRVKRRKAHSSDFPERFSEDKKIIQTALKNLNIFQHWLKRKQQLLEAELKWLSSKPPLPANFKSQIEELRSITNRLLDKLEISEEQAKTVHERLSNALE